MRPSLFLLLGACILSSCSGGGGSGSNESDVVGPPGQYKLLVFSTPNCQACETVLPGIDKDVNTQLPAEKRNSLTVTGYIVTDADGFDPPDQATATAYQQKLGLSFPVLPDPWRWTTYSIYFGSNQLNVPDAVIIEPNGNVMKFGAGVPFTADQVYAYLMATMP